jgi:carbohydrate binding protein with CBM4/9 domain/cellulase (glycosyl hydrolase family 5)
VALGCTRAIAADELFPFVPPWDDASPGVTNISAWLEKPAGAHGFVAARDGHFFAGDKRIRFFGANLAFGGNFPTHADAEKVAARMAKFGINCVRFHHMDTSTAPNGILQKDRRTLDPESLDRLDYFIAQLKKNGVYANLNLHVGNEYPGMAKWDGAPGYFKGVDNFFPPMIEQQRDYARALLTHANKYTGASYVDEPAVAFVEINNENGLMMEWNNGSLDALPDPYAAEFRKQWNDWLAKKYGSEAKLAAAWKAGEEPLGAELLKTDRASWNFEQHGGAKSEHEFTTAAGGGEAIHVRVTQPGGEAWHVQFSQPGLKIDAARSYTITFRARASAPRKISVALSQTHEPWKVLASAQVKLTAESKPFRLTFSPQDSDDKARLSFTNLGSATGDCSFADISLRPGGVLALREGEKLGVVDFFTKNEIGSRTSAAQRDWNRFLFDTEAGYWPEMMRFVKSDLKAHSLVLGSATGFSPWPVQAMLDVVDAHAYWQHPHFPHRQWDANDWIVKNVSMAGAPDGGTMPTLALRRVAGKPFIVTEYNAAAPNTYSSEAFLELCAVAGLQDWDGMFAFAYSHRKDQWDVKKIPSFFDIDQHPTKMATLPAALALFMRADVHPPAGATIAETTPEGAIESIRKGGSWVDARAYGIQREETFQHPVAMRIASAEKPAATPKSISPVIQSDNGELTWDTTARRMLVATPRSAGVIGSVRAGESIDLGDVKIMAGATMQNWATINITVMDGADFKTAKRILITATGYAENTDMHWKDEEKSSVGWDWGKPPSLVEGIAARIALPGTAGLKAWALDDRGQRKSPVAVKSAGGKTEIDIGPEHKTLWYELAAE